MPWKTEWMLGNSSFSCPWEWRMDLEDKLVSRDGFHNDYWGHILGFGTSSDALTVSWLSKPITYRQTLNACSQTCILLTFLNPLPWSSAIYRNWFHNTNRTNQFNMYGTSHSRKREVTRRLSKGLFWIEKLRTATISRGSQYQYLHIDIVIRD